MARKKFHPRDPKTTASKKTFHTKDRIQVEGRNSVLEALNANRNFKRILIDRKLPQKDKILEIIKKARGRGIQIEFTAGGGLNYISETEGLHQGVIGILEKREQKTLKQILDEAREKRRNVFLLLLTAAEDERNLGAVIRTASAVGVDAVIVPQMKRSAVTPVVARTSAGAVEFIPVIAESTFQVLKMLEEYGIKVFAVELGGKKSIYDVDLTGDVALVIGGEDKGVSSKVQESCEETLIIPMPGRAQSLNMSVSAALVMYEKVRQEKYKRQIHS